MKTTYFHRFFSSRTFQAGNLLLLLDGCFLLGVGGLQVCFEISGHFFNSGPLAQAFFASPYTIGFLEAHGLAAFIGILFIRAASPAHKRLWHLYAAGIHILLGGANILFWTSFLYFGWVLPGIGATLAHALFVVFQVICFISPC